MVVKEPSYNVSLLAVGDVMLARKVDRLMRANGDNYPFEKVAPYLRAADITFGNLESPLSDRGTPMPGKGIQFRARPEMAFRLDDAGFDVLSLGNNHSFDYDEPAFLDTMESLRRVGIEPVGGGTNIAEARKPVIIEKNGIKVGFLAYTIYADIYFDAQYRRAFQATAGQSGVVPLQQDLILEDLALLKPQVDISILSLHWGTEYNVIPDPSQRDLARALVEGGADVILGHHPHVIQGLEKYQGSLIAYSLGNFIFDQNQSVKTRQGLMLQLELTRDRVGAVVVQPVFIEQSQPYLMQGLESDELLTHLQNLNRQLGTESTLTAEGLQI